MNHPETWIVAYDAVRPARPDGTCFYCRQPLGSVHEVGCVLRKKTVVIEFTGRVIVSVPQDWNGGAVEFQYNDSSLCLDNLFEAISNALGDEKPCMCNWAEVKFVREATEDDEKAMVVT